MNALRFLCVCALLCVCAVLPAQAQAPLIANQPVDGTVPENGSQTWRFQAYIGGVMSFIVEGLDGFDPIMTISDSSGRELTGNDDYVYPISRDALIEAVTLNRTDTYSVAISGFAGTGGRYRLTMLPGFARLNAADSFEDAGGGWRAADLALAANLDGGTLNVTLETTGARTAFAISDRLEPISDFYMQARVVSVNNADGWIVGAALRRLGSRYYLLEFNELGRWRFSAVNGAAAQVLRDWTPHPNIVAGTTQFTFGVLARGAGFDIFYNGGFVGGVSDLSIPQAGEIGLAVGTSAALNSRTHARFDDLLITVPFNEDGAPIIPQRLIVSDATNMTQALQRAHVVGAVGERSLTVPNAVVEFARTGINRQMVGQGTTYTNFALGAAVTLRQDTVGVGGCGLIFRAVSADEYTLAYFDSSGGYGVSQHGAGGFQPGLFASDARFIPSRINNGRHHMLLIADRDTLYYYLDGYLVGTVMNPARSGEIGAAVVNFENAVTSCTFTDLWLWRW